MLRWINGLQVFCIVVERWGNL